MIKIIKGTYGYVDKDGIVKPKTAKDEPFSLSAEQEKRLVDQGVAVKVEEKKAAKAEEPKKPEPEKAESTKKANAKKSKSKKSEDDEEPPVLEAVDPE